MAIGIKVILFGPLFDGCEVFLLADALASVQIISSNAAHAPTLQILHSLLLSLAEFTKLQPNVFCSYAFGRVNVLADAASRGKLQLVTSICSQMGVLARQLSVSARASEFLSQAKTCIRRLRQESEQIGDSADSPSVRAQSQS